MKIANRITSSLALAALLASCVEEQFTDSEVIPGFRSDDVVPTEIVATLETTKASYREIEAGSVFNLRPEWEVGDEIIALTEDGADYMFTVKTVNDDKSATLSGEAPADCRLHLIYCPGVSASNLDVDYTAQTGTQTTMPAVMFSDGEVKGGTGAFNFRNAGGIVGISAVNGIPKDTKVTKITVSGENLSSARIAVIGSALTLTATEKADDAISVQGLDLTVDDANGTLSAPVLIAVPAGAVIATVSAFFPKVPETITKPGATPQEGVDYVTIAGIKWAKWNIGANSETDYGWFFPWAGTEGYVRYADTWQSAESNTFEFSYSPSEAYTALANDYVYVKGQTFAITGHSFDWANTPYHIGNDATKGWTKYIPTDKASYWWPVGGTPDNKTTLDPEDDAASVNWGGNWRMPTWTEYVALKDNSTNEWIEDYNGTGISGRLVTSKLAGEEDHSIFFPTVGYCDGPNWGLVGDYGFYRNSSLWNNEPEKAFEFFGNRVDIATKEINFRCLGMAVRAILDE